MAFTDSEKARIRHFLGYPSWSSVSNAITLGFPSGSQPLFLLEQAFNRLLPGGEETVRKDLCQCEATEAQIGEARSRMKAEQLGTLKVRKDEAQALREELVFWSRRLADDLGSPFDPYGTIANEGMGRGMNARVTG